MALNTSTKIYGIAPALQAKKLVSSNVRTIYGLSYPLNANLNAGFFSKESGKNLVRSNLRQLLM